MLLTLALVVLGASIAVFFSQEFIRTFKKIFAIRGVKLFLPLFFASWLIFTFDYWVMWFFYYYRELLQTALNFLIQIIPFHQAATQVALVILLTAVSVLPVIAIDFFMRRKNYKEYKYPYTTSAIIWLLSAVLLSVF